MDNKYNIMIRPVNITKCPCSGEIAIHTMTPEQKLRLNRYLNKYFRFFWQEVDKNCKKCN
jgi:hypothetical protein